MYTRLLTGPRGLALLLAVPILALIIAVTPAPAFADSTFPVGTQAYVALDDTEFYSQPDYGAAVVGRLPHGAIVQISQEPHTQDSGVTWYGITVNSAAGWIPGDDISHDPNAAPAVVAPAPPAPPPTATAAPAATPARSGDARGGTDTPEARTARLVSIAMSYRGYRYVHGGISPAGFDCSGFVYFIFNKAGIGLGRAMWDQINAGQRIAAADLRPGDLVYFKNTYHKGVSHIAIYIGNGKIVHACNERVGVTVSDLWSPYWVAHYAGAVRIVH